MPVKVLKYSAVVIILPLFTQFGVIICSHGYRQDPFLKKEVNDFVEFLKQKTEDDDFLKSIFADESIGTSDESAEFDSFTDELESEKFESIMKGLHLHESFSEEHLEVPADNSREKETSSKESSESPSVLKGRHVKPPSTNHHQVEEFLFFRRSDALSDDPIVDIIDRIIHDDLPQDETPLPQSPSPNDESVPLINDKTPSDDICQNQNLTPLFNHLCADGPEYEIQYNPMFPEILKQDMEKMLLNGNENDNKCDYGKDLTMKDSVEDRALCPFEWSMGDRNPSRIPEYIYQAKCSCQVSRTIRSKRFACREIKKVIPVLWFVGCSSDSKRKYRQGWEEVSVACTPLEEKDAVVIPLRG